MALADQFDDFGEGRNRNKGPLGVFGAVAIL
jgi:hypothetical protein